MCKVLYLVLKSLFSSFSISKKLDEAMQILSEKYIARDINAKMSKTPRWKFV